MAVRENPVVATVLAVSDPAFNAATCRKCMYPVVDFLMIVSLQFPYLGKTNDMTKSMQYNVRLNIYYYNAFKPSNRQSLFPDNKSNLIYRHQLLPSFGQNANGVELYNGGSTIKATVCYITSVNRGRYSHTH